MGRTSREKGKRGEREVAAILRAHGYDEARRGQQYNGSDGSADVVGIPGYHVEVKRVEALKLYDALTQSQDDAKPGEVPIVVHRRNGKPWVVIMELEQFLDIISGRETHETEAVGTV